jgi:hypothetical protein
MGRTKKNPAAAAAPKAAAKKAAPAPKGNILFLKLQSFLFDSPRLSVIAPRFSLLASIFIF